MTLHQTPADLQAATTSKLSANSIIEESDDNIDDSNGEKQKTLKQSKSTDDCRQLREQATDRGAKLLLFNSSQNLAPKFKHQTLAPQTDIDKIRELIVARQSELDETHRAFFESDNKRLMTDDWLISRFLFRGYKMAKKRPEAGDVFEQTMRLMDDTALVRLEYKLNFSLTRQDFPAEWWQIGGLISGLPDKSNNSTIYLRLCLHKPKLFKNDAELKYQFRRMLLYVMDCAEFNTYNKVGTAVTYIFDFTNVSYENYDVETVAWMVKLQKTIGPKILAYTIIYNLPWLFSVPFKLLTSTVVTGSNKEKLEVIDGEEILDYIPVENLPEYLLAQLATKRHKN